MPSRTPVLDQYRNLRREKLSREMSHDFSSSDRGGNFGTQDVLDTAALATSPMPVVGDAVGLAADLHSFKDPENRTLSNSLWTLAGMIPFVPSLRGVKNLFETAEDVKDISPKEAAMILDNRETAVLDKKANKLYFDTKEATHNEAALEMMDARADAEGVRLSDVSEDKEYSYFSDDTVYGAKMGDRMFSREALTELEKKRTGGFAPNRIGGDEYDTWVQQDWENWKDNYSEALPFISEFSKEGKVSDKVKNIRSMYDKIGKQGVQDFLDFIPDTEQNLKVIEWFESNY